jgi:L-lactate dehydrogenase complex protein LldG
MSSRNEILNAIRRHTIPAVELPSLDGPWTTYEDPVQQFSQVLTAIGGLCISVASLSDIRDCLTDLPGFTTALKVASAIPALDLGLDRTTLDLSAIEDPHEVKDLDFAILPGKFAVAENGSVWVTDETLSQRAVYFAVQHLALVVSKDQIVSNMHQAYERIRFNLPYFGMFIAGPSKTADIEQSLVIGAQGARSLTVFLVDGNPIV